MINRIITLLITVVFFYPSALGQNIEPAPMDKSVVYFVRTVKGGFKLFKGVRIFDEYSPLGYVTYRNFMRLECAPGNHKFWIMIDGMSPNTFTHYKQFVDAELLQGKIYLIEIRLQVEGIRMEPVDPSYDEERMSRIKSVLNSKSSIKANKMMEKRNYRVDKIHESWAKKGMKKYPKFDDKDRVRTMYPEWFVEPEELILSETGKNNKIQT